MAQDQPPSTAQPTDAEVAAYVAETCVELANISVGRPRLCTLRYLLSLAQMEAEKARETEEDGFR